MNHSPAAIIRQLLVNLGVGAMPTTTQVVWPIFVGNLPDAEDVPDNAICVYDVVGNLDGRLMAGTTIRHPGIQVRVRSKYNQTGYLKILSIFELLDNVSRTEVTCESSDYLVQGIHKTSDILPIGSTQEGTKRREHFTLNLTLTVREN